MTVLRALLLAAALAPVLSAQDDDAGMMPSYEVAALGSELDAEAGVVIDLLAQASPAQWQAAGGAYDQQRERLLTELNYVQYAAQAMNRKPESMPAVVDVFLWIDRSNAMAVSMVDGIRRYQDPALADLIEASRGRFAGSAEKLKIYMRQLAISLEKRMEIADEEAQRCRTDLLTQPR